MDVTEYLRATAQGAQAPSLIFLNQLIERHLAQFPFSSVNVLLGNELSLDDGPLFERVVEQRRGGYCFEHNKIFSSVLEQLGFNVRTLMARVSYNGPLTNPRTHRVILLSLEGEEYLVDVGFGPLGPCGAVKLLSPNKTQLFGSSFRVERLDDEYYLQVLRGEGYFTLYVVDLSRYTEKDCELGHFFSHRHPNAVFVNNLIVSKIEQGRVCHIRNTSFFREADREVDSINSPEELGAILRDHFDMLLTTEDVAQLYVKAKAKDLPS